MEKRNLGKHGKGVFTVFFLLKASFNQMGEGDKKWMETGLGDEKKNCYPPDD